MIFPPKLKRGDTIAVFSPSSPATINAPKRYERARNFMQAKGFNIYEGNLTGKSDFYRSGSIVERANELNELIRNPEIKCIISSIGGMNSNSILPYIDYETLRKSPKIIIGYSDVTAVLLGIYSKTGLITFYGPAMVASFGEFSPLVDYTYESFEIILSGKATIPYTYEKPPYWADEFIDWEVQDRPKKTITNKWLTLHGGKVKGRLIGGNLDTMIHIWNSQYMPEIKNGDILLIEDALKKASNIERNFAMLKLNGVFDKIGGLILGKHERYNDCGCGRKPYQILQEVLGKYTFPLLAEFDCCHTHPMLTIPIGCQIELDADSQTVTIIEEYVK